MFEHSPQILASEEEPPPPHHVNNMKARYITDVIAVLRIGRKF